ncbi:MAG: ATP-grasp domain-containing protein, partial [Candidatus Hydrogenedentota bacterium]
RRSSDLRRQTRALALELGVIGLMNIQFAVRDDDIYLIEVNPRASRTVPFVSKAMGIPLAKIAARIMAGKTLDDLGIMKDPETCFVSAKEVVLPFIKFPGVDTLLGPEMRSTGEVMGISRDMGGAFAKSQIAAGNNVPTEGTVFLSLNERDKSSAKELAQELDALGFTLIATKGTAAVASESGIEVEEIFKVGEGRPNIVDRIINGDIHWIINTPLGIQSKFDEQAIRRNALERGIPTMTTLAAAKAAVQGIRALRESAPTVLSLQEYHAELNNG